MSSVVQDGVIQQLSVSQAERFDHRQTGGCNLAWFFERVHDQKPDGSAAKSAGDAGHKLKAYYFTHGSLPSSRAELKATVGSGQLKKTVDYAILKGDLPKPGPDMMVEWRGDGQEKFSRACECTHSLTQHDPKTTTCNLCDCTEGKASWIPLDKAATLNLGGIPWELFIDLAFNREGAGPFGGGIPTVIDHKFSADPTAYAKSDEEIINTIQMPVYVLALMHRGFWQGAKQWRLFHNYNRKTSGLQFFRGGVFSLDQVLERKADIEERVIPAMKAVAKLERQQDVPFNRKACEMFHGCPHQSICIPYKENKMALNPEEAALFADLEAKTPAPAEKKRKLEIVSLPDGPEDEEAKLEAEFAARKAKIAADKAAKAELEKKAADEAAAAAKAAAAVEKPKPEQIPDSPMPDPAADAGQPPPASARGKGTKSPAVGPSTVTVTVSLETFDRIRAFLK